MSQTSGRSGSFFTNLSIRQKLIFSFLLIGILIGSQSFVSLNSVNVFSENYNAIRIQSNIRELALDLEGNVRREGSIANQWIGGIGVLVRSQYEDVSTETDNIIEEIQQRLDLLESLEIAQDLNVSFARDLMNTIIVNNTEISSLIEDNIFGLPGNDLTTQLISEFRTLNFLAQKTYSKTLEYVVNNDTAIAQEITGSGNLLTDLNDAFSQPENTLNLISDPTAPRGASTGTNISQDLYRDWILKYNTEIISPPEKTNPREQNIRSFSSAIIDDIENFGALNNMTEAEAEPVLNRIDLLSQEVEELEGNVTNFITEIEGISNQLNSFANQLTSDIRGFALNIQKLTDWATLEQNQLSSNFSNVFARQNLIIFFVILTSILLLLAVSYFINSQISQPIRSVTQWSQLISRGDLSKTQRPSGRNDEIGVLQDNFREMTRNLRGIIDEVQTSSALISDTSDDLASSSSEINATAEEVSAIAQTMAKGSTEQAEIITTIVQELQESSEVVEDVVTQITENLDIIKDLSEQTNILALNTAIEAANAGEYARGFQVIAENIRKMSEESKRTSRRVSKDSREILEQLSASFNHISDLIENVASVSEETAASAEEVAASAEEMTASMESVAASSNVLSDQSQESLEKVNQFKLE